MSKRERTARARSGGRSAATPAGWEDVNQRLAYLGELERQIRALQDQFQQKVAVLKQQWLEAFQPLEDERRCLEAQIEEFYWSHKEEIEAQGRKSVDLVFGRLGSRVSRSVMVTNEAAGQQWLAAHGLERFLRTRTEVDREALRSTLLVHNASENNLSTALRDCPVIHLCEAEQFWYQVNRDKVGAPVHSRKTPVTSNQSRRELLELPAEGRERMAVGAGR